ncbi:hypothetical protein SAMN04488128_101222 [Chitinophaga eiseniae]|uniref:Uncharacterized protein n=1 Tax=Chitinophaga eiseniae TaxID=634771 RepID=A0A1T4KN76_9BACT|nr:hypothetical protein SAMN04488128_101222 [Chitinophaga eiseniae]
MRDNNHTIIKTCIHKHKINTLISQNIFDLNLIFF